MLAIVAPKRWSAAHRLTITASWQPTTPGNNQRQIGASARSWLPGGSRHHGGCAASGVACCARLVPPPAASASGSAACRMSRSRSGQATGISSTSSTPNGSRPGSARWSGTATRRADRGVGRCGPGQHRHQAQRARTSPAGGSSGRPERLVTPSITLPACEGDRSQARAQPCPRVGSYPAGDAGYAGPARHLTSSHAPDRPFPVLMSARP
jgi:hypothetical protein